MIVKILILGWVILVVAILLNFLAGRMGITTWYPFVEEAGKSGFGKAFMNTSLVSKLFLFFIYPGALGLVAILLSGKLK